MRSTAAVDADKKARSGERAQNSRELCSTGNFMAGGTIFEAMKALHCKCAGDVPEAPNAA